MKDKIKKSVKELEEYKAGKTKREISEKYSIPLDEIIALSSNENPFGTPKKAQKAIKKVSKKIFRYPSPKEEKELKKEIKTQQDLAEEVNVILGAGEDGVLENIMKTCVEKNTKISIPYPTFSLYEVISRIYGADIDFIKRNEDFSIPKGDLLESAEQTDISFFCSPNNPTGNLIEDSLLDQILKKDNLVILDAAYSEFTQKNYLNLLRNNQNLVILRTFSKAYGLAGLRVGYGLTCNKELAKNLRKTRSPFSVAKTGLVAAKQALKQKDFLEKTTSAVRKGRKFLEQHIPFKTYDSEANFVLAQTSSKSSEKVTRELMKKGVIVRDCSSIKGLGSNYFRISVGRMDENKKVVEEMKKL
ncbi:histidinol-phosphate transaminase [archaeon SCG-AAA382B04]|nr:histidinol-phosphate transaminase [archaeon SCG-AAA382B04]